MTDNFEKNMKLNEEILFKPRLHWSVYIDTYVVFSTIFAFFCLIMHQININLGILQQFFLQIELLIGTFVLLRIIYIWLLCYSVKMAVTTRRIIHEVGFFGAKHEELDNQRIEGIEVKQTIIGRFFNYGDIHFSGTGTSKIIFHRIWLPWQVKSAIEEMLYRKEI